MSNNPAMMPSKPPIMPVMSEAPVSEAIKALVASPAIEEKAQQS
jgi:hypothetical protein